MATFIPYGDPRAISLQSRALFASCMQRRTTLNRLTGPMPKQAGAEMELRGYSGRRQTSTNYPIVRAEDLSKMAGDEIKFDLIQPMQALPIMGAEVAEGKGSAMKFDTDSLRINQARFPISAGDTMSQQRTEWQFRPLARAQGQSLMDRFVDQRILVHLAGARGFHWNVEWNVPLASHADFSKIMVNSVRAPTKNRHFLSTGSGIEPVAAAANEISIATTDTMNIDVIDALSAWVKSTPLPPQAVVFDGDEAAYDSQLRVLLVSPEQYLSIKQSPNFRTFQSNAMQRAQMAKDNPLFRGDVGLWGGILVVEMPKPIRFYAGDPINWKASHTSTTETTTDLVPAAFGTDFAVDRAILLGGQALAWGMGMNKKTGNPFFWSEKMLDHDDKVEVLIGTMDGLSKIMFNLDFGGAGFQYTDFGVVAIDTAVRIAGV